MITITLSNQSAKGAIGISVIGLTKETAATMYANGTAYSITIPVEGTIDWYMPTDALKIGLNEYYVVVAGEKSNTLTIKIEVAIDKVNKFIKLVSETGYQATLNGITKTLNGKPLYFDYTGDDLKWQLSLINDSGSLFYLTTINFNKPTITVSQLANGNYGVYWSSPTPTNNLYLNDKLIFQAPSGVINYTLEANDGGIILGTNTLKLIDERKEEAITTFTTAANTLFAIEDLAAWYTYQLNGMAADDNYQNNAAYIINTICNIGTAELATRTLNEAKTPDIIIASLNLLDGAVSDNPDLDYYQYALGYTFIATEASAKALYERINTFAYNNNGKAIPLLTNGYNTIANYTLPVMSAPWWENGETRVAITWYITLEFTKAGVYSDEVKWTLNDYPLAALNATISTSYGVNPIQENGDYDVKSELNSRTKAFSFSLLYTHSELTNMIVKDYILGSDSKAFTRALTLTYQDDILTATYNVIITSANYSYSSGAIVGLTVNMVEKEV